MEPSKGTGGLTSHPLTRVLLDTSVLQSMFDFGDFIYDGGEIPRESGIWARSDGAEQIDALRKILFVGQRLPFQFCISEAVLAETAAGRDSGRMQWAYEMLDHWHRMTEDENDDLDEETADHLSDRRFGFLSIKDRLVLQDALRARCFVVLTMDAKLARACSHLSKKVRLEVLRPKDYWERLRPWAGLYI